MALTESNMMVLGTQAPPFKLVDTVSGRMMSYNDIKGPKGTVVVFSCNHCPYVIHINAELVRIAQDYEAQGICMVAISSNDVDKYPMDAPDKMQIVAKVLQYPFPYLYDETQDVAKAYDAACTPDIYLFDENDCLFYRDRIDGSRPGNSEALTGVDLRSAIDDLIAGNPSPDKQYPSAGCNIKWK